ncbi:MAG: TfoX/Sxy family protein [Betaproteobacteria bacterium]|nr:TfoX/Sxy family protein [Betaproteobacteria bacterium]
MGYDEKTAERVRRILSVRTDVVEKKMFGGLCFMVNGSMCCGITTTAFMVRVGPDQHQQALARPHVRPMDFTGRPLKGMIYVDPAGYKTDAALGKWVACGVDFVCGLPAANTAMKKPRKRIARK